MIREWNKCGQSLILEHGVHWSNNWQARNQFVSEIETFYTVLILKIYLSFHLSILSRQTSENVQKCFWNRYDEIQILDLLEAK